MNSLMLRWLISALSLALAAWIVPGIQVHSIWAALIAAMFLGIANAVVRPILFFFTLPLTVLTLGLFALVINGLMLYMVAGLVQGFEVAGFGSAVLGSLFLSIVSTVINWFVKESD